MELYLSGLKRDGTQPDTPALDVPAWTVAYWLTGAGLGDYAERFTRADIDPEVLP